ncbi:electron transfer flavoprotein subunit beta/FixA family protein [bacterium]|nr:electron transfer flavoprotein subunit beta/FixA family protein [bacterium]
MKICVPIKQVPETSEVKMDPETGTMLRDGVVSIINPLDLYSIEAAIQLKEQYGGTVTAVTMGPPRSMLALKEAIAMGCDDAVQLTHRKFAGADTWSTAYVLANAIKKIDDFDLIVCGERATDGDTGQVGPGIASFLKMPLATYVNKICDVTETGYRVHRLVEGGYQVLSLPYPSVLTVVKEVSYPRLPTLRGKLKAKKTEIAKWGPDELDVKEEFLGLKGSPTRVVKIFHPKVSRSCEKWVLKDDTDLDKSLDRLVALLQERELL